MQEEPPIPPEVKETVRFRRQTKSVIGIVASVGILSFLLWYAADLVLLAFLSVLFAIFLRSLSDPLARRFRWPEQAALWFVISLMLGLIFLAGQMFSRDVIKQIDELSERLPLAVAQLQQTIQQYEIGRRFLDHSMATENLMKLPGILSRATGILTATFGFLTSALVVLVGGVFLAINPSLYIEGAIQLIHPLRRARIREVLTTLHQTLRWWLIGKSLSMVFIGTITGIGLQMLGVHLALLLGIIAGLFSFIPFIGPLLSALPALLLSLVEGPHNALYVLLLYIGIQVLEGNFVTPYIEKKTVFLPPALTIFSQLLAGLLFGFMGILLASPLTVVGMILIKMLYIEDVLENSDLSTAESLHDMRPQQSPLHPTKDTK